MSHPAELPPLNLRPRPSRLLGLILLLVHLLGAASVTLTPLPWWVRTGLLLALLAGLGYGLATHALCFAPWAIRAAEQDAAGDWNLALVSGVAIHSARLRPTGFTGQHFAVLNFQTGRLWHRTLVLAPDAIDAEGLRRLRTGEGFRRAESLARTPVQSTPT